MATIVTVHGTYAQGAESGTLWWQRGSAFEAQMRELVEGADGTLDFAPFVWDGQNSEMSRRSAGTALVQRLRALEQNGQHYSIVGHSHGGSVILAALTQCIYRRRPLPGLSRWITIGTPFVRFTRKMLLFSRLGVFGKAAWVSLLTFFSMVNLGLVLDNIGKTDPDWASTILSVAGTTAIFLLIHAVVGWNIDRRLARDGRNLDAEIRGGLPRLGLVSRVYYATMLFAVGAIFAEVMRSHFDRTSLIRNAVTAVVLLTLPLVVLWLRRRAPDVRRWIGMGRAHRGELARRTFATWLAFRHPQDEAVEGLQRVSRISFPIFGEGFATSPLTFLGVLLVPLLTVAALLTPSFMVWLVHTFMPPGINEPSTLHDSQLVGGGHDFRANLTAFLMLPVVAIAGNLSTDKLALAVMLGVPVLYLAGAVVVVAVTRMIAAVVSRGVSIVLNRTAWRQIRASAYGNDTRGEVSVTASPAPGNVANQPALPIALALEISAVADAAAAGTLSKFRTSLNRLAFAGDTGDSPNLVADYLTWDELIHTAYFKVPLFNKYVAYVIANSKGFKPTARFLADPDYLRLAAWYADYHQREHRAPVLADGASNPSPVGALVDKAPISRHA